MSLTLTRNQVRRIDQRAIERYGIAGIVLMENAGRHAAGVIRDVLGPTGTAMICCGTGNNGGDGCVIARHLHNTGWTVSLLLAGDSSRCTSDTTTNLGIIRAMEIELVDTPEAVEQLAVLRRVEPDGIIVDALLGTGFHGDVRSPTAELIQAINSVPQRSVVAIGVPSGLDCDTGAASNATVRADLTVTFVAAKVGFATSAARPFVGRVEVVDIGVPRELIDEVAAE